MFDDLILHPKSRAAIESYLKQPTHALLLTGKNGVGLGTIAKVLAREIAGANVVVIEPQLHNQQKTANINIDDIRALHEMTRARRRDNLMIVIDNVDQMTNDAPQAFLKLLEEPTPNVFYILTSHNIVQLPETIRSRTQIIEILPPPAEMCDISSFCAQSQNLVKKMDSAISDETQNDNKIFKITAEKRAQIQFLGDRKPAEIVQLLTDEQYFRDRATAMNTAKNFVAGNIPTRLKTVAATTARETAIDLAQNIAKLITLTAPRVKNPKTVVENLELVSSTIDNLTQNGNVRAQLTNLALGL